MTAGRDGSHPITLTGRGFAPNSSVRFALYATPASGQADAGASAGGVRIDLLGTPTVGPDGTVRLQTTVPAEHDAVDAFAYLARGVGPDATVRSLVLWANDPGAPGSPADPVIPPDLTTPTPTPTLPDLTTPVTPAAPVTVQVRNPVPSRRVGSAAAVGGLATTGVPVAPIVVSGVLLLVAGAIVRRAGRPARLLPQTVICGPGGRLPAPVRPPPPGPGCPRRHHPGSATADRPSGRARAGTRGSRTPPGRSCCSWA
ncbi:hypothetical protein GCM10027610_109830 [Dactylosporangium cerinum]